MHVELTEVTKDFGTTRALQGVDLEIDAGQRVGLVGPNGSGKTTLIRAIIGLIDVDGDVRVGDESPFDERREIADAMAYVPQIAPEFAIRVELLIETVVAARDCSAESVFEITEALGFELDPHLEKPYRTLSGGMKQKLLIGLAMAGEPSLLVMDEPTASLDASARSRFFDMCGSLDDLTLILCSHRLGEIRHLVDEIVELEAGSVREVRDVGSFVAETGRVYVECRIAEGREVDREAMREVGLEPSAGRHWTGVIDYERKLDAVRNLLRRYEDDLEDLVVEDLDDLGSDSNSEPPEESP